VAFKNLALAGWLLSLSTLIGFANDGPFDLPVAPIVTPPAPKVSEAVAGDQLWVVNGKTDAVVRDHPKGLVKITKENGPLRIRGKFAGGTQVETKTFPGPFVFIVEAVPGVSGKVDIDIIPLGFKAETEIISRTLSVNSGTDPPPIIPPVTPTDPLVALFQTAIDGDPDSVTAKDGTVYTRLQYASKLAALYEGAAKITVPTVKTYGELFADLKAAAVFPETTMPKLKIAVGTYLDSKLAPTTNKAIDKAACVAEFNKVAATLKSLKETK